MATLYLVPPDAVDFFIPRISSYLERAMGRRPVLDIAWIVAAAKRNDVQIWVAYDDNDIFGAGMTEIVHFPNTKIMAVRMWSADHGRLWDWLSLMNDVEEYAKEQGLDGVEVSGRDGWVKLLKSSGYGLSNITVRKMFDDAKQSQSAA